MEATIDHTIQYGQSVKRDSEYKFTKIVQNTGGTEVKIQAAQQTSVFEIPVVGFNLAKSFINFQQIVPKNETATHYAFAYRDTPPWQRLELYTRAGVYLMDVTNYNHIYQAFGQRTKKIEDFQGSDTGILVKRSLTDLGIKRVVVGAASGADTIGRVLQEWRIEGCELYNSVMSLDKTLITGEVLNLRITWLPAQAQGYWATNDTGTTDPIDIKTTSTVEINNLALYLAQETNPAVLNELSEVVATKGMSVLIPYVHSYKTNLSGASNAISLRFSRGHGVSLERIYTLFTTGAEASDTRYDAVLEGNVNSFYSLLDSKRIQEFDISVSTKDYDWMKKHEKKERVVSLQLTNDNTNFAHSDNWCGGSLECAVKQHIGGLSLDQEKKYDLYVNKPNNATVNYYSAAVCQKQLMMGPSGVQVM